MTDSEPSTHILATSDSPWETGNLRFVTAQSEHLNGRADVTLFIPPEVEGLRDVPLIVLLHGVYGSHWNWTFKGGVHRTALRLIQGGTLPPVVIAMPSDGLRGSGTAYLPHPTFDAERWIVDDVPHVAREAVPAVSAKSPIFIAGLSMGGFGAMRLGAKYGDRFKGISAHSSVTDFDQFVGIVEEDLAEIAQRSGSQNVLGTMLANRDRLPPIRFDCGLDDAFVAPNRSLHRSLADVGIDHVYEEFPGDHDWSYWQIHIEKTLLFFAEILETAR